MRIEKARGNGEGNLKVDPIRTSLPAMACVGRSFMRDAERLTRLLRGDYWRRKYERLHRVMKLSILHRFRSKSTSPLHG